MGTAYGNVVINTVGLNRASQAFTVFGKQMLGIGAVAVVGFGLAAKAAGDFERKLDQFRAITGATETDMNKVSDKVLQLGQDTIYSAGQVAEAVAQLAKAGISTEDILDGAADAAVHLAAATDTDLSTAAIIAANAMHTFNLEGKDMVDIVDTMTAAANASTLEVEDLAYSIKYAGAPAASLKISMEDLTIAFGLLGKAGIRGSTAGTSMRRILLNLTPVSKKAATTMRALGIITADGANQFYTAAGSAKSLSEISEVLHQATAGLSDAERIKALNTIFGNRAIASAILLADKGAKGYNEFAAEMGKLPSAAQVSSERLDNLSGDVEILRGNIETMLVKAGGPFQETLRGWVQSLTRLTQAFANLSPETQKTILQFILWGGTLFATLGMTALIIGKLIRLAAAFKAVAAAAKAALIVIGLYKPLAGVLETLALRTLYASDAFKKLAVVRTASGFLETLALRAMYAAGAFKALAVALLTNPIFLIIAAIVALGVALFALYKKNKGFREFIDKLWQSIQKVWDKILNFFKGLAKWFSTRWKEIGNAFKSGVAWVKKNWDILLAILTGPVGVIILVWRRFGDTIKNTIGNAIEAVVRFFQALPGRIVGFVAQFITTVVTWLSKLPGEIAYIIGFIIGRFIRLFVQLLLLIANYGPQIVVNLIKFIAQLPGKIAGVIGSIISKVVSFLGRMVALAIRVGSEFLANVVKFFTQLPGKIADFTSRVFNVVTTWVPQMISKAVSLGQRFLSGVVDSISQLPGKIAGFLGDMLKKATDFLGRVLTSGKEVGTKFYNGVKTSIQELPKLMGKIIDAMIKLIQDAAGRAFDAAEHIAGKLWSGFKKGLFGSPRTKIEYAVEAMTDTVATELDRLKGQVRSLQRLGLALPPLNPTANTGAGSSNTVVNLEFNFEGVSAKDANVIKQAITGPQVLDVLVQAARSGRRPT